MKEAPKSWLLPSAFVGYLALSAIYSARAGETPSQQSELLFVFLLALPVALAFCLRRATRLSEASRLATGVRGVRLCLIGLAVVFASLPNSADQGALSAAFCLGLALCLSGALLSISQLQPPPGLLQGHPQARSLDAFSVSLVLWSLVTVVFLLRTIFPSEFPLDPVTLNTALLFSSLGSLLLLGAVVLRTKLLRGLEMGVGDRANAALSLCVAGTLIGAGAGFVMWGSPAHVASLVLALLSAGLVAICAAPGAARVSQVVRGGLAVLIFGTPLTLLAMWLSQGNSISTQLIVFGASVCGVIIGLLAKKLAQPLAPEGSRWLLAMSQAMDAALHPEPELALREALMALRKAEPTSKKRPELYRLDPSAVLSVDIAGYLKEEKAEFPVRVLELAEHEPSRTLREESLQAAQVRKPEVRPLLSWFEAHRAKSATVLMDEAAPVGLLILPRGKRKADLSMDEAELLARLTQRLAGLISVTASLRRSRLREVDFQKSAALAEAKAHELSERLSQKEKDDRKEAEARAEILRATAHSPAAQIKLQEIESHAHRLHLRLLCPVGVDPVPWAAHAHLQRFHEARPLVVLDLRSRAYRELASEDAESRLSPLKRALEGTLVLLHLGALSSEAQISLAQDLKDYAPQFLVTCAGGFSQLHLTLDSVTSGPEVRLPTLAERAEDLQALIFNELSQLGLQQRGEAYGIEPAALRELVERGFPGNDDELKGLLAGLVGQSEKPRVTLKDLHTLFQREESARAPEVETTRLRARRPPRSRRY